MIERNRNKIIIYYIFVVNIVIFLLKMDFSLHGKLYKLPESGRQCYFCIFRLLLQFFMAQEIAS